ncbi:MAG: zf-HC2 domain-containing protein [Gammaproteobacteria bacterium]|nr:zf-HC2 domain-containing protein [Gammaproteobacteria bacterium]
MNHRETQELLAWYAAGTLDADETSAVRSHVDDCRTCREELDDLAIVRAVVAEVGADEPAYDPAILERAMSQIDGIEQAVSAPGAATRSSERRSIFAVFAEWLQWSLTPNMARLAIAGQFAVILGLALALGTMRTEAPEEFVTAAGQANQPAHLTVVFKNGVTELEMRELLLGLGTSVVAGPGATGIYQLRVAEPARVSDVLTALKAHQHIFVAARSTPP